MDEKCMNYKKTCFKNSEKIFKTFFHIVFLEKCNSFELLQKGLSTKKRLSFRKTSEKLEKEQRNEINESDGRCRDLLLHEHCKKLFNLKDIFWCDIKCVKVDVIWLLKLNTRLDKLQKTLSKIKRKKLRKTSTTSLLRKMVL